MKTKLLKKVRRRFTIEFFPHRKEGEQYIAEDHKGWTFLMGGARYATKSEALDAIVRALWNDYKFYSRRFKLKQIRKKIWYNESNA